ncbi:hypothetical protein L6R53_09290 [Myxococcota bacterium]|nr:hypothetical protein [Myxococcota bacterium]
MTRRDQDEREGLPEWADRLREWLEDLLPSQEPAPVPVPVRPAPRPAAPARRRRRR